MTSNFTDIQITGLNVDKTQPSHKASGLRHMYLGLSSSPPAEWVQLFDQERSFPRHTMWRHAWVEGSYIVVDCVPEEIEQCHLRDLRKNVKNSNEKYIEFLARSEVQKKAEEDEKQIEKTRLEQLASRLKFDSE